MSVYRLSGKVIGNATITDAKSRKRVLVQLSQFASNGTPFELFIPSANSGDFVIGSTVTINIVTGSEQTTIAGAVTVVAHSKED